jgi:hypothetical protein
MDQRVCTVKKKKWAENGPQGTSTFNEADKRTSRRQLLGWGGEIAQVVECLSITCKALSSNGGGGKGGRRKVTGMNAMSEAKGLSKDNKQCQMCH